MREGIFNEWAEAGDALDDCTREEWPAIQAKLAEIEDEIFAATGQRPPFGTGWGAAFARIPD